MFIKQAHGIASKSSILFFLCVMHFFISLPEGLPLFYWQEGNFVNFGDYLSLKLIERIIGGLVRVYKKNGKVERKLLGIGSILTFAQQNDVIWGSGVNGKYLNLRHYKFTQLDVRAVRGPLTRRFLMKHFKIKCPEIYGDPALLMPLFFPEFKRKENPEYDYIIIPHYSEMKLFPKDKYKNVVYPTEPWYHVVQMILNCKLVISGSLHGIIVAEAYKIPARLLKMTHNEPLLKFQDYYFGTNRMDFKVAYSIEEALQMGGEGPFKCDLKKLYKAFPFEFWPNNFLNRNEGQYED